MTDHPFRFKIGWSEWCYENEPFNINQCLTWTETFTGLAYESLLMVFISIWLLNRRRQKKFKESVQEHEEVQ